jgi:P27 family predicted phage terminase small subunit
VDPPNWLKGDAARERYTEYAAELLPVGLLTRVDVSTLANLCRLEILSETLEDALSVDFVEGSTGQPAADPRWSHFLNLEKQIDQLRRQMGMTPSSRTSVSVERPQEENEVEKWRRAYDG